MLFQKSITVPITATETAKVHATLKTAVGMLDKIWVNYKAGCHELISLQIFHGTSILIPSDATQALIGDDVTFESAHNTEIKQGYETLDIYAWTVGTNYPHDVTITVNVFTKAEYSRLETQIDELNTLIKSLSSFMGVPSA